MLCITLPNHDDKKKLQSICKKMPFVGLESAWEKAYQDYAAGHGNPWSVSPASFTLGHEAHFHKLYATRKSSGVLRRMRREAHRCCPMCGSGTTGSLDHYLPQDQFAEFSIFTKNLVPTCPHCNSSVKGATYKGTHPHERFLHPYFDTLADAAIWNIDVVPPFVAPEFRPTPVAGLSLQHWTMIRFHLDNVLGRQFYNQINMRWSSLPAILGELRSVSGPVSQTEFHELLSKLIRMEVVSDSINGWFPALYRGVIGDAAASAYVASRI